MPCDILLFFVRNAHGGGSLQIVPGNSSTALLREKVLDLGRGGNDWVTFDAAQPLDITTRTYVDITDIVTSTGETLRSSELGQGSSYYRDWEAPTLGVMPPFLQSESGAPGIGIAHLSTHGVMSIDCDASVQYVRSRIEDPDTSPPRCRILEG